ncbi:MAG: YidC/Oxa1 family insertase periplasmic-domain containing protein [Phycisphaerales bacterium]|jgi:YidC/Oxa1 family membrane protein insertase|nr:YidC/Oxa1 family insertase periplasmic-domain containing protein [Phycisphaerales bacterium]
MNTKRLITLMVVGMAVVIGWQMLLDHLYKKNNWRRPGEQTSAATQPAEALPPTTSGPTTSIAGAIAPGTTAPSTHPTPSLQLASTGTEQTWQLGSDQANDPNFRMAVVVDARGAGIRAVVLNEFSKEVKNAQRYSYEHPIVEGNTTIIPLATRSIVLDNQTVDLSSAPWQIQGQPGNSELTLFVDVQTVNGPVRILKRYQVQPKSKDGDLGYEILVTDTIQNLSTEPVQAALSFNGPVPPGRELESSDDRQIVAGYMGEGYIRIDHWLPHQFEKETVTQQILTNKDHQPMVWAGASSVYFNALVMPVPHDPNQQHAGYLASVQAYALNPEAPADDRQVAMTFTTSAMTLKPQETQSIPLKVYFGPKSRQVLESGYYKSMPRSYDLTLNTLNSGCSNWCTFGWLIGILVGLLRAFHFVLRDWGLAIIALVVLVRVILHPITKRSTISMQKMGKMGPEMERLKKKYADNKDELNKAMMQVYKEQGFTPIFGCLPMFLQMPIWIALWQALQGTFELRHAEFLWGWTWIHDLARPDELIRFSNPIPLIFGWHLRAINVLPLMMAVVTYFNQKYMPKPAAASPEQQQQQKMMQWMSMLFPLMFYSLPSGLNLYYVTSMALGIYESKRIRDHINQREEQEKAERILVDAKPTRGAKTRRRDEPAAEVKKGGLAGWLASLQARADEVRRQADKGRNNK